MIKAREREVAAVLGLLERNRAVAIVGARQVGKTTLAHMVADACGQPAEFFDLEDPRVATRLADPMRALENLCGLVVLDEIQMRPDIFGPLRVLCDRPGAPAKFLILGSAAPELLRQSAESLAGRIAYRELGGFAIDEVGGGEHLRLWRRGGLPLSCLAASEAGSFEWRLNMVRTFLERDLPQLGINVSAGTMRRFWTMLAHYHGCIWNSSELARAFGVAHTTVRAYLDRLTSAMAVRQLQPWHENLSKRQVKAPKVYIKDSGLLHALLGLSGQKDLEAHPKVGASWEGFVIEQVIRLTGAEPEECFFWATHSGAELDLLLVRGGRRRGFEVKFTSAPKPTPSMRMACADLKLDSLDVVHAGRESFPMTENIRALAIDDLQSWMKEEEGRLKAEG